MKQDFSFNIARQLMCLCEYYYRFGLLHGSNAGDPDAVRLVASRDDHYTTFQELDRRELDPKRRSDYRYQVDMLIAQSRRISANHLANYLRQETSEGIIISICTIADAQYRKGLLHGLRCKDRKEVQRFFADVGRGGNHTGFFSKWNPTTFQYMDEIKTRINDIHFDRTEAGLTSGMSRLSELIGGAMSAEWKRKEDKRAAER